MKAVNYFCKTVHLRCLSGFWIRHWSLQYVLYFSNMFFRVELLYHVTTLCKKRLFGVILVRIFPTFSRIRAEYGEIRSISPYLVRMRENAEKMWTRITPNTEAFYAVYCKDIQTYILYILYIDIHLWLS